MARLYVALAICATASIAAADPGFGSRRVVVDTPVHQYTRRAPAAQISPFLYLNRCKGGCTIHGGANDARSNSSSIPPMGTYQMGEFANAFGQIGATGTCKGDGTTTCTSDAQCTTGNGPCDLADAEWAAVVQCMKEVYSPFAVTVTDTIPAGGVSYTMAVIAGNPQDIGQPNDVLGIAPLASDCSPQDNVISFSFANHHSPSDRVNNICWTAAQETAHAFGLDHEFSFPGGIGGGPVLPYMGSGMAGDGESACNDPMTYSVLCGGEKFFRNQVAKCGEYSSRACKCTSTQNSHAKLINVFGEGQTLIGPPTVSITGKTAPAGMPLLVTANAGSKRGVSHLQIFLNGFMWEDQKGLPFTLQGQLDPGMYTFRENAPDGVIDIQIKAFDDLGTEGDSTVVTVTKGQPCADASACATGQKCDQGKCFWDPPTGMLGDACTYPQFCQSNVCMGTADKQICTQACSVAAQSGSTNACPEGYDCISTSGDNGICFPGEGGGCCSLSAGGGPAYIGTSAIVLGLLLRRRRRA